MFGIIYRVYFHPLAKYPGPFFAKITNFYGAYYNGRGELHIQTEKQFKKYGPIVRQGPNKLIFQSEKALMGESLINGSLLSVTNQASYLSVKARNSEVERLCEHGSYTRCVEYFHRRR